MKKYLCLHAGFLCLLVTFLVTSIPACARAETSPSRHTFRIAGRQFILDGKPFQIISGSMHYTRIPRAAWRDRFRKARAMGLNTISTYVFWNVHEPQPGVFDFSGQNDLAEYIREAQQAGLYVILRPGPYVCAEWELGGYPAWLLKDRRMVLRSADPKYLAAVQAWFHRLGKVIRPLLLQNGGPILAIQVENEYGSFGEDHQYMKDMVSLLKQNGMGAPILYTADGAEELSQGTLPGLPAVVNFGTGEARQSFTALASFRPSGPRMSGEYWDGWFDHWGEKHHVADGAEEASELKWMLSHGDSVNLYMFDGGTSFGWMNGANSDGSNYQPDTTSYDYDAPIDEAGNPRSKYFLFRDVIASVTGRKLPPVPAAIARQSFAVAPHPESASLWQNLPRPARSQHLLTMEDLGQSYGYILYRTGLAAGGREKLVIDGLHDYAQVYIHQALIGTLDRRLGQSQLALPARQSASTLDILVENSGRVNFTKALRGERKGIVGSVTIGGTQPQSWDIYSLPMIHPSTLHFQHGPCTGPCFFRVTMQVPASADTYLDTRQLHKGEVWLNDRPLGRFWSIGPQFTLFTPGSWLRNGENRVVYFDLGSDGHDAIRSVAEPIFDTPAIRSN
jgi:beta-galactosidase